MLDLITILGPTASGKTSLAVALAARLDTEIISADSRQIYRSMDIGTGKDLAEYTVGGKTIPYHLIDICPPGYKYNLFEYIRDYHQAYDEIVARGKTPILCGGTGLYLEAVLKGYSLPPVPENPGRSPTSRCPNSRRYSRHTRHCTTRPTPTPASGRYGPSR